MKFFEGQLVVVIYGTNHNPYPRLKKGAVAVITQTGKCSVSTIVVTHDGASYILLPAEITPASDMAKALYGE